MYVETRWNEEKAVAACCSTAQCCQVWTWICASTTFAVFQGPGEKPIYNRSQTAINLLLTQLEKAFFRGKLVLTYAKHVCNSVGNLGPFTFQAWMRHLQPLLKAFGDFSLWIKVGWLGCWLDKTLVKRMVKRISATAIGNPLASTKRGNRNHWWMNETLASTAAASKHETQVTVRWTFTIGKLLMTRILSTWFSEHWLKHKNAHACASEDSFKRQIDFKSNACCLMMQSNVANDIKFWNCWDILLKRGLPQ